MSIIAEFSVSSPDLVLYDATTSVPTVQTEVTSQVALDGEKPMMFFWANGDNLDEFEAAMADDPTVTDIQTYTDLGERRLYRVQVAEDVDMLSYPVWVKVGATRLETTGQNGSSWNRFRFPDRNSFKEFREWSLDNDIEFTLHALYTEHEAGQGINESRLSAEQAQTLREAYKRGYFQIPQGTTLADIATELDISSQAVSERLRRAYATLIEQYVLTEDE